MHNQLCQPTARTGDRSRQVPVPQHDQMLSEASVMPYAGPSRSQSSIERLVQTSELIYGQFEDNHHGHCQADDDAGPHEADQDQDCLQKHTYTRVVLLRSVTLTAGLAQSALK